jgi:hypothetical protein
MAEGAAFLLWGIAMTTVQAEEIVHHPLEVTAAWLSDDAGDPVAFVEGAFPWARANSPTSTARALISRAPRTDLAH